MPGGGSSGSQTTRVEPPSYQLPYLQAGLGQASQLYNQGRSVVPFSPQTEASIAGTTQRALQGSPVTSAAQNYATTSLNGGFLGSNPYLDQTFNRAALQTQNQLASQFGASGRGQAGAEGLRSQQLNDLATGIYGGAYENERNRQQGVLGQAGALANQDYIDLAQLGGAGAQVEGLAQQYADAPGANLDQYLGRVSGNMGQTTIAPRNRNVGGGLLGGALTGASLFGPWGAVGGGILGGILG
jgi:hypothetical protein